MAKLLLIIFSTFVLFNIVLAREEYLEPGGAYILNWDVDFSREIVTFQVTARTTGFVGLGISNGGEMLGADIVIGGIWPNGTTYLEDRHGLGSFAPELDDLQSCYLIEASENATHTRLAFSRFLDTKDSRHDTRITNESTYFIWSFGASDRIQYHGPNRGNFAVNILDV